jgi:transposase
LDLTTILPHLAGLSVAPVALTDEAVTLAIAAPTPTAACPECGVPSGRIRSRYWRTVADRPWGQRRVVLVVRVRRFACQNGACSRRIFAEPLPTLVARYARRTAPHQANLGALGLALGGRAGARLAGRLGVVISHDTVLRLAARAPVPAVEPPRVVGIDDFAFRRGRTYGTLVVDLERHRPIAVLPDRSAATVGRWLGSFPSITVVVRDRYDAYAAAVTQGAPQAAQVVDRFHLLTNLGEAIQEFLFTKTAVLRQVRRDDDAVGAAPGSEPAADALPLWRQRQEEAGRHRQQRRIEHHLAQDFTALLRERRGAELDAWIERADRAGIKHLRRFALGLKGDLAVRAGLTEVWSNGRTEGHVARLKYVKRQGYGRAGVALLRQRVLHAA